MKKKDLELEILQNWVKIQKDEDLLKKKYEKKTFNN